MSTALRLYVLRPLGRGASEVRMELHVALTAYRERIKHVLSQMDPAPTDEWINTATDQLMAPFESGGSNGNGLSRSPAQEKPT